jgi:hypothetical protein
VYRFGHSAGRVAQAAGLSRQIEQFGLVVSGQSHTNEPANAQSRKGGERVAWAVRGDPRGDRDVRERNSFPDRTEDVRPVDRVSAAGDEQGPGGAAGLGNVPVDDTACCAKR